MKYLFTTLLALSMMLTVFAVEPPQGSFTWGVPVPLSIDYQASETLSVSSATIQQFTVTYQLQDPAMAQYIAINGDVVTVLKHYAGDNEQTQGKIYIKAVITGMTEYDDTEITTHITTRKITPTLQWNCVLGDMSCGSSVLLSAVHGNTDRPLMGVTYTSSDNISSPSGCVQIDQNTGIMTATNVGNGIYITAKIDSTDNYKSTSITYFSNDSIVRFNVVKGNRIISWDSTDFSVINNLYGDLPLKVNYLAPEDSLKIVSSDPLTAEVMSGNILHIYKAGKVRLTATVSGTNNYYEATSDTTINIPAVQPTIAWDENVISDIDSHKIITSTTCNYPMKVWVTSNYGDTARYEFSIPESEQGIATVIGDTAICCYAEGTIHLSAVAKAAGRVSQPITHEINIYTGELDFVTQGNWDDVNCWSRSDLANNPENYQINIVNHCTVRNGENARCKGLKIYANGSITIEPQASLYVEGSVENLSSETSLRLKADRDNMAQLIMAEGNPLATVEMYLDHSIKNNDTIWSSHGIPLDKGYISDTAMLSVKKWKNGWVKQNGHRISLEAFEGYLIANKTPKTYTTDGRIVTGDKTLVLHRAPGAHSSAGHNFISNSYTAPVNISEIEFLNMNSELFEPVKGQYRTLPKYTSFTMGYGKWNPGVSLFAEAVSNESAIKIDYRNAVIEETENTLFNMLKISVTDQEGHSDTLVLMDADFCTEQYDDGYDGTKWEGDTCMPQLFANTEWGKAYVNVEQSIVAQRIGFKAARNNENYTIHFHTEGLDSTYSQLYLFDAKTQGFVDIMAGDSYTFQGSTLGENDRFTIMRDKVTPHKDKHGRCIMVLGDKVLLVGFENSDVPVRVFNLEGKQVCEYNTQDGPWLLLPPLAPGFYFINAEHCTTKFYK
ncbi:MAG: hypothetical protein MJ002_02240 [Paludibacteraceae bacterium]|nr:hypothetical protein [Paludibacteraceae bacterium]